MARRKRVYALTAGADAVGLCLIRSPSVFPRQSFPPLCHPMRRIIFCAGDGRGWVSRGWIFLDFAGSAGCDGWAHSSFLPRGPWDGTQWVSSTGL